MPRLVSPRSSLQAPSMVPAATIRPVTVSAPSPCDLARIWTGPDSTLDKHRDVRPGDASLRSCVPGSSKLHNSCRHPDGVHLGTFAVTSVVYRGDNAATLANPNFQTCQLPPWQYTRHVPFWQAGSELPPTLCPPPGVRDVTVGASEETLP